MSLFKTAQMIDQLQSAVRITIESTRQLELLERRVLEKQPSADNWSIAQVIAHLNSYNQYYLRELNTALDKGKAHNVKSNPVYRGGWLGDYFTAMMAPGANGLVGKKLKSPAGHAPSVGQDGNRVLREFIAGQERLYDLLEQTRSTDPGKLRVPISISRLIRLKLGDTFRFLIAHQQRHFVQVENNLRKMEALMQKKDNLKSGN